VLSQEKSGSPGANPTIVIYNASVVNFYNAMGSLARFENKNILFCFEKRSSLLQRWRCSCKFKNRRIGSWLKPLVVTSLSSNQLYIHRAKSGIVSSPPLSSFSNVCSARFISFFHMWHMTCMYENGHHFELDGGGE
jgi:hypothetical protein